MDFDPGTARRTHRNARHAAGFQTMKPLALCNKENFGLNTFTCVMADHPPSLWPHVIRCLLTRKVPFWPGG